MRDWPTIRRESGIPLRTGRPKQRRLWAYFSDQGPWLLCSIVLPCAAGLFDSSAGGVGRRPTAERIANGLGRPPPAFEQAKVDADAGGALKPFEVGYTPLEPTELNTETLTLERPAVLAVVARNDFADAGGSWRRPGCWWCPDRCRRCAQAASVVKFDLKHGLFG